MRKKSPHSELFWSAFSRIRAEYGEIHQILYVNFNISPRGLDFNIWIDNELSESLR